MLMKHAASNDKQESGLRPADVFEGELTAGQKELWPHSWQAKEFLSVLPAAMVQSRLHARRPITQSKGMQK